MTTFVSNKPVQQIGFASTTQHDWLKKLASLFHPIRSRTKTSCYSLALLFPRFASAACHYFDWLAGLSASFVIGKFWFLRHSIKKRSKL